MPLSFLPYDKKAIELTRDYLSCQTDRFCDWTPGTCYMWRTFFHCRYAIVSNCLIFETTYVDGKTYYSYPLGPGDKNTALKALECHCADLELPLQYSSVSPADTRRLQQRHGENTQVIPQRDFFDYLYHYQDLATFAGRRYSGQRNHINQFKTKYPQWRYETINHTNLPIVLQFLDEQEAEKRTNGTLSPMEQADFQGSRDLLHAMEESGMTGGCILVEDTLAAFAVGERQGDVLYIHAEKGNRRYVGIYQMIVREYAAHNGAEEILYINREDDSGDTGLRQSKLAYRPCAILEKNLVIPLEKEV